jgi:hypothetical protein
VSGERGRFASLFAAAEYGVPLAAELPRVAGLLGRPLAEVKRAARRVEPYIAADGSPHWSVRLVLRLQRVQVRAPGLVEHDGALDAVLVEFRVAEITHLAKRIQQERRRVGGDRAGVRPAIPYRAIGA